MSPPLAAVDPAYAVVLLVGVIGIVAFALKTVVFDFHPDALLFVGAFTLLLAGIGAAAVDPDLSSTAARLLYHGVGAAGTGLAVFVLAYGRRRMVLGSGKEVGKASVVGERDAAED